MGLLTLLLVLVAGLFAIALLDEPPRLWADRQSSEGRRAEPAVQEGSARQQDHEYLLRVPPS